jgi:hypothetical protein
MHLSNLQQQCTEHSFNWFNSVVEWIFPYKAQKRENPRIRDTSRARERKNTFLIDLKQPLNF